MRKEKLFYRMCSITLRIEFVWYSGTKYQNRKKERIFQELQNVKGKVCS